MQDGVKRTFCFENDGFEASFLGMQTRKTNLTYASQTLLHTKPCGEDLGCGDALGIQQYSQDQGQHQGLG